MTSDALLDLHRAVAELLEEPVGSISLVRITTGLSHNSFKCHAGASCYFVKVYNLGPKPGQQVESILNTIKTMRDHDVPAPELVAYSKKFPNVVIQRFVDAPVMTWDSNFISPVARLYCNVANVSLPHPQFISKQRYLADLQFQLEGLEHHAIDNKNNLDELNMAMVALLQKVRSCLEQNLPDEPLLVLAVHDDFTEKNILASEAKIELLCDWDSFRNNVFIEHFACSIARFSTAAPMQGKLNESRLAEFMKSVSQSIKEHIGDKMLFVQIFPFLATLRHLRLYRFRYQVVKRRGDDLIPTLLQQPLEHCQWMLEENTRVSNWMNKLLLKD